MIAKETDGRNALVKKAVDDAATRAESSGNPDYFADVHNLTCIIEFYQQAINGYKIADKRSELSLKRLEARLK